MLVKEAKSIARDWVIKEGSQLPDFHGAFLHGSINWINDDTDFPESSDVDIMVVMDKSELPVKPGKFIYKNTLLEVSYISRDEVQSPEQVLSKYHLAGSFRVPGIILDPDGELTEIQKVVADNFTKEKWVYKRCEHAKNKILNKFEVKRVDSFPDQVNSWLFPAGITTHVLLTAGLKNPTVRKRYVAVRRLLKEYNQMNFYEELLGLLGCVDTSKEMVKDHLEQLTQVFDKAKKIIKSPFFFASDISDLARPISIEGSWDLIEQGFHREAVFWIVATYSRCQKIFIEDGSREIEKWSEKRYRDLLSSLGISSFSDLKDREKQVKDFVPSVWEVAEEIIKKNPDIIN
ncbi:MAG: hypothetical protein ACOC4G_03530 [Bacillota bacterium]